MTRILAALAVLFLPVFALAQDTTAAALDSLEGILGEAFAAAQKGDWKLAGVLALLLVTLLVRKYGVALIPGLQSDVGGTILGTIGTPVLALAAAGLAGQPLTRELAVGAFTAAAGSAAAWQVYRRAILGFLVPVAVKLVKQVPVVGPVLAAFIERPLGSLLDAARRALLKKAQPKPALAASAEGQVVADPRLQTPTPEASPTFVLEGRSEAEMDADKGA